jgi:hypothetical protein
VTSAHSRDSRTYSGTLPRLRIRQGSAQISGGKRKPRRSGLPNLGKDARPAIDQIRDGVRVDRGVPRDKEVWATLGRTALSALNHGMSQADWETNVFDARSVLGQQVKVDARQRIRSQKTIRRMLDSAWARAEVRFASHPKWTTEEAAAEARQRAGQLLDLIADADVPLTDVERAVLERALTLARELGSTAVNLPSRATAERIDCTEKRVRTALASLQRKGLLRLKERGRSAKDPSHRRANSYYLPDNEALALFLSRETRQMRPASTDRYAHRKIRTTPSPEVDAPLLSELRSLSPEDLRRALLLLRTHGVLPSADEGTEQRSARMREAVSLEHSRPSVTSKSA